VLRADLRVSIADGSETGASALPVPTRATCRASDPYAVELKFHFGGGEDEVVWMLGRDLLLDGLGHRTVGEADVRVWSRGCTGGKNRGFLYLSLSSPVGDALMRFDRGEVRSFLQRGRQIVEFGDEYLHTEV
jgi:hypothetical protein